METKNKKKKNRKPLYILAGVVTLFILFVYFLSGSTTENKAIEEIQICTTTSEVKALFDKYKFELLETNDDGEKEPSHHKIKFLFYLLKSFLSISPFGFLWFLVFWLR